MAGEVREEVKRYFETIAAYVEREQMQEIEV
jgi:hypothetical protein